MGYPHGMAAVAYWVLLLLPTPCPKHPHIPHRAQANLAQTPSDPGMPAPQPLVGVATPRGCK